MNPMLHQQQGIIKKQMTMLQRPQVRSQFAVLHNSLNSSPLLTFANSPKSPTQNLSHCFNKNQYSMLRTQILAYKFSSRNESIPQQLINVLNSQPNSVQVPPQIVPRVASAVLEAPEAHNQNLLASLLDSSIQKRLQLNKQVKMQSATPDFHTR